MTGTDRQEITTMARRDHGRRGPDEAGFSIVEVLIAAAIMLFIALGVIPLFTMAMTSNVSGNDSTKVANEVRDQLERAWQLPFADPLLTLTNADGAEKIVEEHYSKVQKKWLPGFTPAGGDTALFLRTLRVRQFSVAELADAEANNRDPVPLDFDADPQAIQVKEVTVALESTVAGILGGGKQLELRAYKTL